MEPTGPNPKTIVAYLALIMLVFMLLGALSRQAGLSDAKRGKTDISAPYFKVSYNGTEYESVLEFEDKIVNFDRGSVVELYGYLPQKEGFDSNAISFLSYYCGVEVFCGDELLYTYGEPMNQKVIGSGYHYVPLPANH